MGQKKSPSVLPSDKVPSALEALLAKDMYTPATLMEDVFKNEPMPSES